MKKWLAALLATALLCLLTTFAACGVWGTDATTDDPQFYPIPPEKIPTDKPADDADINDDTDETERQKLYTFTLELRMPSEKTEISPGDSYPHSTIDGELVAQWTVPVFGNTLYESLTKMSEDGPDKFTFRLSQHRFYMLHDCTLADGSHFDLETCYIAADGEYGMTANFLSLLGEDGLIGTDDDVQTVTLVYRGWLY